MVISKEQLEACLNLQHIKRFQTSWSRVELSVAEHSFRAWSIYAFLGGKEDRAMLTHDAEEYVTGDIPGPAKISGVVNVSEDLKNIYCIPFSTEKEKRLGKIADILELLIHKYEEARLGDKRAVEVFREEKERVLELAYEHSCSELDAPIYYILNTFCEGWEEI